jgi:ribosomal protein L20
MAPAQPSPVSLYHVRNAATLSRINNALNNTRMPHANFITNAKNANISIELKLEFMFVANFTVADAKYITT